MGAFHFVIVLLGMNVFGGDVIVNLATKTLEGCRSLHRAAKVQLMDAGIRYTISDCRAE